MKTYEEVLAFQKSKEEEWLTNYPEIVSITTVAEKDDSGELTGDYIIAIGTSELTTSSLDASAERNLSGDFPTISSAGLPMNVRISVKMEGSIDSLPARQKLEFGDLARTLKVNDKKVKVIVRDEGPLVAAGILGRPTLWPASMGSTSKLSRPYSTGTVGPMLFSRATQQAAVALVRRAIFRR